MLKRWIKNIKEKKAEEEKTRKEAQEKEEKNAKEEVIYLNKKMTEKYCPIYKDFCHLDCAHFSHAYWFLFDDCYYTQKPHCKLWKN